MTEQVTQQQVDTPVAEQPQDAMGELKGRTALLQPALSGEAAELWFRVRILDSRRHFGRIDVLVTPVEGSDAQAWVAAFGRDGEPFPRLRLEPAAV